MIWAWLCRFNSIWNWPDINCNYIIFLILEWSDINYDSKAIYIIMSSQWPFITSYVWLTSEVITNCMFF